jgi:hypothetical protein
VGSIDTTTDALAEPPAPAHVSVYLWFGTVIGTLSSAPDVGRLPDQVGVPK